MSAGSRKYPQRFPAPQQRRTRLQRAGSVALSVVYAIVALLVLAALPVGAWLVLR